MTRSATYNVIFSEQAARVRDGLPEDRQRLLARGTFDEA